GGVSEWEEGRVVGGLVLAALLAFAVYFAQTAHTRAQEVAAANVELKNEIAEREQAEKALRVSEANYRSLVDNAPYGIARVALNGRIVMANPAMVELLGYASAEELQGLDLGRDVYSDPAERARVLALYADRGFLENVEHQWKR